MDNLSEMSCFLSGLPSCELVLLASIIAIYISKNINNNEVNVFGNFLTAVGANLLTIAANNE